MDYRAYADDSRSGDTHLRYYTLSTRKRLEKANGTSANMVSVMEDSRYGGMSTNSPLLRRSITLMDRWLTGLEADTSADPRIEKIVRAKPEGLREGCNTRDREAEFIAEPLDRSPDSRCEQLYPSHSFPVRSRGGHRGRPGEVPDQGAVARGLRGRGVEWTASEWRRLRAAFRTGSATTPGPATGSRG
ncbi:DUF6351 family protein [Streptomyces sp. M19]